MQHSNQLDILCPQCIHCTGWATHKDIKTEMVEIQFVTCNATEFSIRNLVIQCPYFKFKQMNEIQEEKQL